MNKKLKIYESPTYLELKKRRPAHSDLDFPSGMPPDQGSLTEGKGKLEMQK